MPSYFTSQVEERFRHTLEHYMERIDYSKPKNPMILNVGCGWCPEKEVLIDFFGGTILGIDIDKKPIKALRKKYKTENSYEFIYGDARRLSDLIEGEVDIVVARHPDVRNDDWGKMFKESYKVTRKDGIVVATCYFSGEPEVAKDNLNKAKYKVKVCEENALPPIAGPFPLFSDKYIVIGKK